jgi:acetyl-CoA acetyltransferase
MDTDVWILGGFQSDFARNFTKEGSDFADLTREIVDATLTAAKIDAPDIGVVHVANAFGEMFAEQGHLGAMPATVCDGLWDTPASRHEAACASGSIAALAAMADLRAGNYDTALVLGVELEKTVPVTPRPVTWAPRPGPDTRAPTRNSSGRPCSPRSPTSTTAAMESTRPTCGPLRR